MRGAIPVLTRAMRVEDAHPSVGLLSGATLLAMKLVAAGRIRLSETGDSWRVGPLQPDDDDRLHALATARAHGDTECRGRRGPDPAAAGRGGRHDGPAPVHEPGRRDRLAAPDAGSPAREPRPRRTRTCPTRSGSACGSRPRAEVLEGGGVVVVLQVHEAEDDTHLVDAERLWLGSARATASRGAPGQLSVALRRAADGLADARPAAAPAGARPDGARRRRARRPARARARGPRPGRDRGLLAERAARRADPAGAGRGVRQARARAAASRASSAPGRCSSSTGGSRSVATRSPTRR